MKKSVVLVLLSTFLCFHVYAADDAVVARIGEKKITLGDFNRWLSFSGEEDRKAIETDPKKKASVLKQIVTGMIVADKARKDGFDRRPDVKENMGLLINNFLTVEYLDKVVAQKVEISEDELRKAYEERKGEFKVPDRVRARHILVKVARTAPDDEREKAREKAEGLLKRTRAGEDFSQLASEFSEDPGSKRKGGDVGFFAKGMMAPEFEDAAFSLGPGEVSDVVETNFGFHIIKVEERAEPEIRPYEEVKDHLMKGALIDKKRKAVDEYVEEVSREAGLEIDVTPLFSGQVGPHAQ